MMTVLLIYRSAMPLVDRVSRAVNAITAVMELTEHAVRAEMDTPLKRMMIVRIILNQFQVICFENVVSF